MGCLLSKRRNARARTSKERDDGVQFSKDAETRQELEYSSYYIITEKDLAEIEDSRDDIPSTAHRIEPKKDQNASGCENHDGMLTVEVDKENPLDPESTTCTKAQEKPDTKKLIEVETREDEELVHSGKVLATEKEPIVEPATATERESNIEERIDLKDQIVKLEQKLTQLNKRVATSHIQWETDNEEDCETTILKLRDQISKLEEEIAQQDTRKRASSHGQRASSHGQDTRRESNHGQQDKKANYRGYSRKGKNLQGMLNNFELLLEVYETRWEKQTLEKILYSMNQIPQVTPTKARVKQHSVTSDSTPDSVSLDSE